MNETLHRLKSTHLGNERTIWIRTPDRDTAPRHLAVVLDAEIYRDRVGALAVIADLEARGDIASSAFVFVSMESDAARWRECPCHPPFARFIREELLPWIEHTHPTLRVAGERAIVGLSYTGLAAAYVAMEVPGAFSKVIAQSGSFWWNDCWLAAETRRRKEHGPTDFYLDVGTQETKENVRHKEDVFQAVSQIEGVQRFRDALLSHGQRVKYVEFDGGHDAHAWSLALPGALRWAWPVDLTDRVTMASVTEDDFETLVTLRIAAMRESLEGVGRFDRARARERLRNSFYPEHTQFVLLDSARVGFHTFRPMEGYFQLDHLYVHPNYQSRGIGAHVLRALLRRSDALGLPVHVGALKESASNSFYQRHGFVKQTEDTWDIYYVRPAQTGGPYANAV